MLLASALLPLLPTAASAATVRPASMTASSSAPDSEGVTYNINNVQDAKQSTPWVEGDEGSGLGSWVQADFGREVPLSGLTIWAGVWYTNEYWGRYNRPKLLVLEFSDGSSQEFTIADEFKPQTITLPSAKKTSTVKVKIKGIYTGNTFNDTGISEILFRTSEPEKYVPVSSFKASTTFPADNDGNYEGANMTDGILDSMWCEGNKKSDGTGEWVEFTFPGTQSVSQLVLRNGNAYSLTYFMKSNRSTAATLTFSDGSSEPIVVKDTITEQTIKFSPHDTSKVKLTFNTVKKGTEFDDLCLSEAYFAK